MCGSTTEVPQMVQAQQSGYGIQENLGATGQGFLNDLQSRKNEGLPPALKALLLKSAEDNANNSLVSSKRAMTEQLAGRQLPTGAMLRPMGDLYSQKANTMTGVNKDIAMGDYQAQQTNRDKALSGFLGLTGASTGIAGQKNAFNLQNANQRNQYGMEKYKIDKSNEFDWGKLMGDLAGAGGQLGGAAIMASKREYKKNIKFVRNVKGINFYNFEYKDSKHGTGLQYGVMIDEIEKILPEAVIGDKVNYDVVNSYIGV